MKLVKDIPLQQIRQPSEDDVRGLLFDLHQTQRMEKKALTPQSMHYFAGRMVGLVQILPTLGQRSQISRAFLPVEVHDPKLLVLSPVPVIDEIRTRVYLAHAAVGWQELFDRTLRIPLDAVGNHATLSVFQEVLKLIGQEQAEKAVSLRVLDRMAHGK